MKKMLLILLTLSLILGAPIFASAEVLSLDNLEDYQVAYYETYITEISSDSTEVYTNRMVFENQATQIIPSSTGWKTIEATQMAYNRVGSVLFEFTYRVNWEWDNNIITKVVRSSHPTVYSVFWRYVGLSTDTSYFFNWNESHYSLRQGYFAVGTGGWDVEHSYPWLEFTLERGGDFKIRRGW